MDKMKIAKIAIGGIFLVGLVVVYLLSAKKGNQDGHDRGNPDQLQKKDNGRAKPPADMTNVLQSIKTIMTQLQDEATRNSKDIDGIRKRLKQDAVSLNQSTGGKSEDGSVQSNGNGGGDATSLLGASVQKSEIVIIAAAASAEESAAGRELLIPAGSWATATLMHGFYAPVRESNSLPVVLSFHGTVHLPSGASEYLPDARIVAKVQGDANSERAQIQALRIGTGADIGTVETNGYAVDIDGASGVRGKYVYNANNQILLSSVAGAAKGIGDFTKLGISGRVLFGGADVQKELGTYAGSGAISGAGDSLQRIVDERLSEFTPAVYVAEATTLRFYFLADTKVKLPQGGTGDKSNMYTDFDDSSR